MKVSRQRKYVRLKAVGEAMGPRSFVCILFTLLPNLSETVADIHTARHMFYNFIFWICRGNDSSSHSITVFVT